jgi:hypothetical protein
VPVAAAPAEERTERVPLKLHTVSYEERWFIAVHEGGFGVDTCPAKAILLAQESVMVEAQPGQLLLYVASVEMEPTGFVTWPNGVTPRLVGCTTTHQGWTRRPR